MLYNTKKNHDDLLQNLERKRKRAIELFQTLP